MKVEWPNEDLSQTKIKRDIILASYSHKVTFYKIVKRKLNQRALQISGEICKKSLIAFCIFTDFESVCDSIWKVTENYWNLWLPINALVFCNKLEYSKLKDSTHSQVRIDVLGLRGKVLVVGGPQQWPLGEEIKSCTHVRQVEEPARKE